MDSIVEMKYWCVLSVIRWHCW